MPVSDTFMQIVDTKHTGGHNRSSGNSTFNWKSCLSKVMVNALSYYQLWLIQKIMCIIPYRCWIVEVQLTIWFETKELSVSRSTSGSVYSLLRELRWLQRKGSKVDTILVKAPCIFHRRFTLRAKSISEVWRGLLVVDKVKIDGMIDPVK